MLKRNISRLAAVIFTAASLFFAGCASAPVENPVDPAELLGGDGAIYMVVPVQPNEEFVKLAVRKISGCSEKDAEKITSRTDDIYISVGLDGNAELSADGDFPSRMISLALTEKKGWTKNQFNEYKYYSSGISPYSISLPSSKIAVASKNIGPMLSRFDDCANNDFHTVSMDEEIYSFLKSDAAGSIQVFAPVPKAFIRAFIGANVSFPVQSISGTFTDLKDKKDEFGLKITVKMNDPKTVRAAVAALKLALFPIPAKVVQSGADTISITDITLGYDDLLKFIK